MSSTFLLGIVVGHEVPKNFSDKKVEKFAAEVSKMKGCKEWVLSPNVALVMDFTFDASNPLTPEQTIAAVEEIANKICLTKGKTK